MKECVSYCPTYPPMSSFQKLISLKLSTGCTSLKSELHDLSPIMVQHNLMRTRRICDSQGSNRVLITFFLLKFHSSFIFYLSCKFIVNFLNCSACWSRIIHSGVSWHHCRRICLCKVVLSSAMVLSMPEV